MGFYLLRRVLAMIPVLLGTTFLIFLAVYALPGDPVQAIAGPGQAIPEAAANAIREKYHLNDPLISQYLHYMGRLVQGDFGTDLQGRDVGQMIASGWPVTLKLGLTAWVLGGVIGVLLGTLSGIRAGGAFDNIAFGGTILLLAVPYFVLAYVAKVVFAVQLDILPPSGVTDGWPISYILPACVMAVILIPSVVRLTRASILDNMGADFVDTAVAKGLRRRTVIVRHVLRTSMVPVVSALALDLGGLLSGSVLVEGIFNLPGLGFAVYNGVAQHSGPIVVGIGTLLVIIFLVVNLVVDLLYGLLDPRIRVG